LKQIEQKGYNLCMKLNLFSRSNKGHFSNLDFLQWALPLGLAITSFVFEFVEHGVEEEVQPDLTFISEVLIFGLMGPIIIGFIIVWVRHLMASERQAAVEIHALNRELENKVVERTAALAQRNTELDKANHELQKLDEMKSEFVALVSHELRAPLTAINGGLEVALQSADNLPPTSRRTLEAMMAESARLTQFVQTILDVSRLEAGRITLNLGPVPVAPILHRSVEVILGTRREIKWNLPAKIPPVWADEIHYEQIFRNLLLNADKYSPPKTPIEINVHVDADSIRVEVTDHGAGIPINVQEKIFERFQRGHSSESALPGWGLGLYFAKKLTEAQDGVLTLHSPVWPELDAPGSSFSITMPIAAGAPDEGDHA
jgi:signal transduction histidine kinase